MPGCFKDLKAEEKIKSFWKVTWPSPFQHWGQGIFLAGVCLLRYKLIKMYEGVKYSYGSNESCAMKSFWQKSKVPSCRLATRKKLTYRMPPHDPSFLKFSKSNWQRFSESCLCGPSGFPVFTLLLTGSPFAVQCKNNSAWE